MALETLKDIKEIGGFKVIRQDEVEVNPDCAHNHFILIDDTHNGIAFEIQNGPIKEHGVNGCQVDTLIHAAKTIIEGLNKKFPCRENSVAITKLDESIMWLEKRTKDREKRNVEGTSQA